MCGGCFPPSPARRRSICPIERHCPTIPWRSPASGAEGAVRGRAISAALDQEAVTAFHGLRFDEPMSGLVAEGGDVDRRQRVGRLDPETVAGTHGREPLA